MEEGPCAGGGVGRRVEDDNIAPGARGAAACALLDVDGDGRVDFDGGTVPRARVGWRVFAEAGERVARAAAAATAHLFLVADAEILQVLWPRMQARALQGGAGKAFFHQPRLGFCAGDGAAASAVVHPAAVGGVGAGFGGQELEPAEQGPERGGRRGDDGEPDLDRRPVAELDEAAQVFGVVE